MSQERYPGQEGPFTTPATRFRWEQSVGFRPSLASTSGEFSHLRTGEYNYALQTTPSSRLVTESFAPRNSDLPSKISRPGSGQ